MADIRNPCFARGRILKLDMLENLRDFPRDALDCFYEDFSDGIVCGLTPVIENDTIIFSKGILKHKNKVYLMNTLAALPYDETHTEVAVKIVFQQEEERPDYIAQHYELLIDKTDKNIPTPQNEIELFRFKLKKGAYLRSDYQNLEDFVTEYNTINVIHALYAGYGKPTLSPLVMRYFGRAALDFSPQTPWDVSFAMLCVNSARVERDIILHYLGQRLANVESKTNNRPSEKPEALSNQEIHMQLVKVLELIKREEAPRKRPMSQRHRITLD